MKHDDSRELQEASLIGRIFSLEAVLLLMGIACLLYGIINRLATSIFFGIFIIPAVFLLHRVRRKDWKAHWQEMEEQQKREQERRRAEK